VAPTIAATQIAHILLLDFDQEISSTKRILERIPENDPQWKPHDKSMPIGRLAVHTSRLPDFCTRIMTTPGLNLDTEKFPAMDFHSTGELLSDLERTAAEARAHVCAMSDEQLGQHWKLTYKGQVIIDAPRMVLYRTMFLSHLVHHRAQLGVYLRLLNIPIPGLYGPSADEKF
jgi:uncharacterized damage-inducible protein DinB